MSKVSRHLFRVLVASLLVLGPLVGVSLPAYGIPDPLSPPSVNAVYAYRDILETGDQGYLIDYYIDYSWTPPPPLPTETITEAYLAVLVDTDGVAQLRSVAPYTFVAPGGYGRGLAWIYFNSTDAPIRGTLANGTGVAAGATLDLEVGDNTITVTGAGTFIVTLPTGTTGTATSGTATVVGSPQDLVAGANTVDTGATTGTFTVTTSFDCGNFIWVTGNPTVASGWTGDPPKTVAGVDYWMPASADASVVIAQRVLYYANILELAWSLDMIESTSLGNRLTTTGESYFENVMPNLRTMAPAVFAMSEVDPGIEDLDYTTRFGATMTNVTGVVTNSPIAFTPNLSTGTADAGTNTTLDDAVLTQGTNYWVGARLTIDRTTDGLAPQGQTATVTGFNAALDRLTFGALTAVVDTGDTYSLRIGEYGTADDGTATTLDDAILTQGTNYWNGARLVIISTTDGAAPQGETAAITGFNATNNRLTFGALTAAVDEGDTYALCLTSVTITGTGTFALVLEQGTTGVIANGVGGVVTGSPVALVAGTNTVTVTVVGTLIVALHLQDAAATSSDSVTGTGFDLQAVADSFGVSRWVMSTIVWMIVSVLLCAAAIRAIGPGRYSVVALFNLCITGGLLMGLLHPLVAVLMFVLWSIYTGYVLFYSKSTA